MNILKMNIFQKLSFIGKIQKAVKAIKTVLKEPLTNEVENNITGGINKIAEWLNDIKREVPEAKEIIDLLLKELR